MRYYSFITNTTIEDKDELRKMFIPTKDELERNHMLNEAARKKQIEKVQEEILRKKEIIN